MARNFGSIAALVCLLLAVQAQADTIPIAKETTGREVTVGVIEPRIGNSEQGDEPVVSKPDEVFSGTAPIGNIQAGVSNGEPVVKPVVNAVNGRKMLQALVTKNLPDNVATDAIEPNVLNLGGSGEEVGDSTLGAQAAASGHGANNKDNGVHLQPHGVTGDVSAAGKGVNGVTANVNPDGVGGEGDVAQVGR